MSRAIGRCCIVLVLAGASQFNRAADAYYFRCQKEAAVRSIWVNYETADAPVPCDVRYLKPGVDQVLWSAQTQTDYCEAKAAAFVEQRRRSGWVCERRDGEPGR